jgi:hypothetical protein
MKPEAKIQAGYFYIKKKKNIASEVKPGTYL